METDVRGAEDPQASSGSAEGASLQSIGEGGVVSMEVNAGSEDGQIMATNAQSTSMETIQAGESNGTSGPSVVSPPIGLGLGGLQPLVPRVSGYIGLACVPMLRRCRHLFCVGKLVSPTFYVIVDWSLWCTFRISDKYF
jgi:hypothetical protein